ncbi:MAG: putative portal protein [Prokaryotic dsDNA virus sp.]|nr:MAG: putative portal protein [Prokaryotic dsDNA virus sp.]
MAVFGKHAYTHACVTRASQDIASLPIKLLRGQGEQQTEIDEHEVLNLFRQPSSITDGYLFREQFIVDLMMTGNVYTLIVGDPKRPTSLYRLHPENVRIIPDPVKMVQGYEYTDGGSTAVYPPERVIHIRNASWDNQSAGELYGSGIVEALNEEITADINAQRMASSVSKQGRPDVLLSPIDPADIWDRRRRQEIMQAYKQMTEHGGAMALSGQIKVETLNLSPRDLEFQALRSMVRENISAVCGVPSTVLGLPDANYATARQATITYYEIQQKRARKLEQLMTRIAQMFDPSFYVQIDFSGVDALQSVRTEKLERIRIHIESGMTASEAYAYEGLTDSPFGETETEEPASQSEEAIEQALTSLVQRAKEDELAKIGNMKEAFDELPDATQTALEKKATDHNEDVNQNKAKTTTKFRLAVVYWRGIGAYRNNPASVRPSVNSPQQWAMARVNSYLYALRNGKYRSGKHDTDLLPKDHPMSGKDEKKKNDSLEELERREVKKLTVDRGSVGDKDPTNFPNNGDDQAVALRNSEFERFPHDEAQDLKDNWPEIWDRGGNILGNKQYNRLKPIAERSSSIAETRTEEEAIRLREAWAARHLKDKLLAGVVAQIKWLVVGSRGLSHMRKVISEEKKRLTEKRDLSRSMTKAQKDLYWRQWMKRQVVPAERAMKRAVEIYLDDAADRYARRAETLAQEIINQQQKKAIDFATILGRAAEIKQIQQVIGRAYRSIYILTGNDTVSSLYDMTGRSKPLELLFGERPIMEKQILQFAKQINRTSEKQVQRLVRRGIEQGISNREIAESIRQATTFNAKRAQRIAQTETTKAINSATNEAYNQFEKTEGVKVLKEWIDSRDADVRETHAELGSQPPIPVDQDFKVDGYAGPAPASFGVASLDINCRCTIAPIIIED